MRQSERIDVGKATRMRPNEWSSIEVHVADISACGFKARCDARLMRGSVISIDLPGVGSVEAQISWHRGDHIGARFIEPIDMASLRWRPQPQEAVLMRLLRDRAAARAEGRCGDERSLRRRIGASLPIRRLPLRQAAD